MNQLAYETSFHPGPFAPPTAFNNDGAAYLPQGHALPQGSHQAFAYPGQQREYHDGTGSGGIEQAGGSMMQVQMQPPFPAPPLNDYTTPPYSQPLTAHVPPGAAAVRHSASPPQPFSPNAAIQSQTSSQTPPTKYPMAAPPLPQTPANQQQQQQPAPLQQQQSTNDATVASPKSPQSPGSQSREQQRIALLLSINFDLLAEVSRLQSEGQGGAISPQQAQQLKDAGQPVKMASEEYIQCLRRVQANLAYMMPKASDNPQNRAKEAPKGPAHMTPPPQLPDLKVKYEQLKELFPDWPGYDQRINASLASPRGSGQPGSANGVGAAPPAGSPART